MPESKPVRMGMVIALCLTVTLSLSACGSISSFRMLAPATFGMQEVSPTLFVEPAMEVHARQALQQEIALGRAKVERFYGSIQTTPYFVACATPACSARFGSLGARAAAFGESAIRLSHNGLTGPLVAHEWAHTELYQRVGGWWLARTIPRWFDEGVAVVVADESLHSELNWLEIQRRGAKTPALSELISFADWNSALKVYGETRVDDPDNLRLVYSTVGHTLRQWLKCGGPDAVSTLLAEVRGGGDFDQTYARLGRFCKP